MNLKGIALTSRSNRRNSRWRHGFTLLELLVVVAIIALLAAILFPVFIKVREKARAATCESNLKQMGLGEIQYSQDYDETYSGVGIDYNLYGTNNGTVATCGATYPQSCYHITWMEQIFPYVKSAQIFVCPSEQKTMSTLLDSTGFDTAGLLANHDVYTAINAAGGISYAYNFIFGQIPSPYWANGEVIGSNVSYPSSHTLGPASGASGILSSNIQGPAETIMITDQNSKYVSGSPSSATNTLYNQYQFWLLYITDMDPKAQSQYHAVDGQNYVSPGAITTPHTDGFNVLYYNGHVKWKIGTNAYEWYLNKSTAKSHGFTN